MHHLLVFAEKHPWTLAGIFTLLLACVKAVFQYNMQDLVRFLFGFILEEKALSEYAYKTVLKYLRSKSKARSPNREGYYAFRKSIKGLTQSRWVFFRSFITSVRLQFYKGMPIWVSKPKEVNIDALAFVSLRGMVNWTNLISEAAAWNDQQDQAGGTRFKVVRLGGSIRGENNSDKAPSVTVTSVADEDSFGDPINYTAEQLLPEVERAPLERLALTPAMAAILKEIKFWHGHENWYKERQIAWRRGYCLYGKPGVGKTSLVRAIAQYLDLPVFVFDIASMNSQDFYSGWKKASQSGDRIILFEDFDAVFHGRENVTQTDLSIDVVLNTLDGVEVGNGYIVFITTNHIEHLDPALIRKGRMDKTAEIVPPDYDGRYKIAYRIVTDHQLASRIAAVDGRTGAEVQEVAVEAALASLWGEGEKD